MTKLKVLFLPKYTQMGASSRYRIYQYLPFVKQLEIQYSVVPLFPESYLYRIYSDGARCKKLLIQIPLIFQAILRRFLLISREVFKYDVVYLQYEALPYLPLGFERQLFSSQARVIVDYDDAVYATYEYSPNPLVRLALGKKIHSIAALCHTVVAGNQVMAEWANRFNSNVVLIPTSIDLRRYALKSITRAKNEIPVVGWIGTPVTVRYLHALRYPLQKLSSKHDFILKVIGVPSFKMQGVQVKSLPWSEESEFRELYTCDIGIMPLWEDEISRGKSALKLVQYLASGLATVASPVGANCDVVENGKNGLLATTDADWIAKLTLLLENPTLRQQLGETGRYTVEKGYSLQANAPRWINVLKQVSSS